LLPSVLISLIDAYKYDLKQSFKALRYGQIDGAQQPSAQFWFENKPHTRQTVF
jgi:hypothetical protein